MHETSMELQLIIAAEVGGSAFAIGGHTATGFVYGKFANGAITGAFVGLFNLATYSTTKCNLYTLRQSEHPFAQPYLKVVSW